MAVAGGSPQTPFFRRCTNHVRLFGRGPQFDIPNSARNVESQSHGRLAVEFVHVFVALAFQPAGADRTDTSGGVDTHTHILRQTNDGMADASVYLRFEILFPVAREVRSDLA